MKVWNRTLHEKLVARHLSQGKRDGDGEDSVEDDVSSVSSLSERGEEEGEGMTTLSREG